MMTKESPAFAVLVHLDLALTRWAPKRKVKATQSCLGMHTLSLGWLPFYFFHEAQVVSVTRKAGDLISFLSCSLYTRISGKWQAENKTVFCSGR